MVEASQFLSETILLAWTFAKEGRVASGYRRLSSGLLEAKQSSTWCKELEALWRDAISIYEGHWFPGDWHPLIRRENS